MSAGAVGAAVTVDGAFVAVEGAVDAGIVALGVALDAGRDVASSTRRTFVMASAAPIAAAHAATTIHIAR